MKGGGRLMSKYGERRGGGIEMCFLLFFVWLILVFFWGAGGWSRLE